MQPKQMLIYGSVLMALAVAFGAFGAHIVEDMISAERFDVYQTGVEYHFYHALGLLIIGSVSLAWKQNRWFTYSAYCLITGIIIFSGSLYTLTLTDTSWLGMVTPLGGLAFIAGWICFAVGIAKINA